MTRLMNSDVQDLLSNVNNYKKTVQDAVYDHYKNIYKLTKSANFRGKGAEAYKEYLQTVTINYLNALLNIIEESSKALEDMKKVYDGFESSESGAVDTEILSEVKSDLESKKQPFDSLVKEIEALNARASKYIDVQPLNDSEIDEQNTALQTETDNITNELEQADEEDLEFAKNLLERIEQIKSSIDTINNDYHTDGKINADKVIDIKVQGWYKEEITDNLQAKMREDPFYYDTYTNYWKEDQWAQGYTSDTYVNAGYSLVGGSCIGECNDGVCSLDGKFSGANGYAYGQITDYLKGTANAGVGNVSASYKAGFNDKYKGVKMEGKASLAEVSASAVLGTDNFNGYIKGEASFLAANGNVTCQYEGGLEGEAEVSGKATLGEASFSMGTSLFSVPENDQNTKKGKMAGGAIDTKKQITLLGANLSLKATAGAEAGGGISSKKAIDNDSYSVYAVTIKGDLAAGIGLKGDVTFPLAVPKFNW